MKKIYGACLVLAMCFIMGCNGKNERYGMQKEQNETVETAMPMDEKSNFFTPLEETKISEEKEGEKLELEESISSELGKYNSFNRMMKGNESDSLFLIDETKDVVYFVNQNKDNYIYCLQDGEEILAISMPAKELCLWEGRLYFMIDSYGKYELGELENGDIYVYMPEDGTVESVYAAGKLAIDGDAELEVNEGGIYFSCIIGKETMTWNGAMVTVNQVGNYRIPFEAIGTETIELEEDMLEMTTPGWMEYMFSYGSGASGKNTMRLINRKQGLQDIIEIAEGHTAQCCVVGDKVYYLNGWNIGILDLLTGEREIYDYEKSAKEKLAVIGNEESEVDCLEAFVATEDYIWGWGNGAVLRINKKSNEQIWYRLNTKTIGMIKCLYTDGKHLYASYVSENELALRSGKIVKILTEGDKGWDDLYQVETLNIEYLTD